MELIRFTTNGSELNNDGLHLPGLDAHDSTTLCGACWPQEPHESIDGEAPTCKNCISIATQIFSRYSKKQAKSWVPNGQIKAGGTLPDQET